MGAVTYPDPHVASFVNQHLIAFQVNTEQTTAETRELIRAYRLLWEPGLVILDPRGSELRRMVGYLGPADLLAELRLALGLVALNRRRNTQALAHFQAAADGEPLPHTAPEALYWSGIAAYRIAGNDLDVLEERWDVLRRRHPASTWWRRADVFGMRGHVKPRR